MYLLKHCALLQIQMGKDALHFGMRTGNNMHGNELAYTLCSSITATIAATDTYLYLFLCMIKGTDTPDTASWFP